MVTISMVQGYLHIVIIHCKLHYPLMDRKVILSFRIFPLLRIDKAEALIFVFKLSDSVKNIISSFRECEGLLLPASICSGLGCQGVDLADGEPGQGGEDKVEQVLANMDHDVFVLEDSIFDGVPGK